MYDVKILILCNLSKFFAIYKVQQEGRIRHITYNIYHGSYRSISSQGKSRAWNSSTELLCDMCQVSLRMDTSGSVWVMFLWRLSTSGTKTTQRQWGRGVGAGGGDQVGPHSHTFFITEDGRWQSAAVMMEHSVGHETWKERWLHFRPERGESGRRAPDQPGSVCLTLLSVSLCL